MLESIGDESVINNLDERKYYVQLYTINMLGYLLDQDKFKVSPAISRGITFFETEESSWMAPYQIISTEEQGIDINIQFEPTINSFSMVTQDVKPGFSAITYNDIVTFNVDTHTITVNGGSVMIPFSVVNGDTINITITKTDVLIKAYLVLKGINT